MSKLLTFHGRASNGENDSVATPPILGVWVHGAPPTSIPASIPRFTELVIDGPFAAAHGQTCEQVTGEPCDLGDDCDHFAQRLADRYNTGHEPQDPAPFVVSEILASSMPVSEPVFLAPSDPPETSEDAAAAAGSD